MTLLPPRVAALAAATALTLLGAGCSSLTGTNNAGYVPGDGQVAEYEPGEREGPIELSGETVDGGTYDLAEQRGKVVVVNVWWSGCGPCIKEMPMLTEAAAELGDEVEFVGINIRDNSAADAQVFEDRLGVDYPSIYAPDGQALLAFPGRTSPKATPSTLVLDPEGRVASVISGEIPSRTTLLTLVESAQEPVQ
ncbi:Thiol-disulfide oxidoreductase ResA [Nocardioides dokdonensis FR1436]|uniref:Thiol-disulfide oxidoreductase ResA n=1 Tax=Nocardioides dokdonensis FR1436 TaxID=1300347 RepID=A0A1A9GIC1_9ACTN|nr:TlpA disulfide reductase family protein [Nocardioides dokdonensis]ANH37251.1 Thiol-disulfide oxidoreductase ResA [Nocardioides dokdonensis FR1436]